MDSIVGITTTSGGFSPLPLLSCSISAEVIGFLAGVDSTLKYVNDGNAPVEVSFICPFDELYTLVAAEVTIGERNLRTTIKSGSQDHGGQGATSSRDILSLSLGNVPAEGQVKVHLKFSGELPVTNRREAKFTLPEILSHALKKEPSVDTSSTEYDFKMIVKASEVKDIISPTNPLSIDKTEAMITVKLSDSGSFAPIEGPVILIQQSNEIKQLYEHGIVSSSGDDSTKSNTFLKNPVVMISFSPLLYSEKNPASELIFLVDRSKPMKRWGLVNSKRALVLLLKSIPVGCVFNIVGFGSTYSCLFKESVEYNQERLTEAIEFVNSMQVESKEADLLSPLKHIIGQFPYPGYSRQIFVVTAGFVENAQACIDEVSQNSTKCRLYTFGLGAGVSNDFINDLAKVGRGSAEIITEEERMEPKVICSLKKSLQPSVTNLQLKFDVPEEYEVITTPATISPVLVGNKLVCYGIIKSRSCSHEALEAKITGVLNLDGQVAGLKGMECDRGIGYHIAFMIPPLPHDESETVPGFDIPLVHQCAAKSLLRDWKDADVSEQECIDLSIESGIVCDCTKFVAVDHEGKLTEVPSSPKDSLPDTSTKHHRSEVMVGIKKLFQSVTTHHHKASEEDSRYDALATLISLQYAEGYWPHKLWLDKVLKEKSEAHAKFPEDVSSEIWATVVALALLEHDYCVDKAEWELVAEKANKWLESQKLDVSLSSLKQTAFSCLGKI